MKTKILLASALLIGGNAVASDTMPDVCSSAVNFTAQSMALNFSDGSFADKADPRFVILKKSFKRYPITSVKFLGNCDENGSALQDSWCNVAGGSPDVYQVDVAQSEGSSGDYPFAKMIVTFNRGGCWVDSAERK